MKLLVLGGTGPCGVLTCQYVLKADIATHDDVQVISGQLTDLSSLRSAISGCDAVVSSLGPAVTRDQTVLPITDGYKVVLEAMRAEGVKRVILLGTTSIDDSFDISTWAAWFVALLINGIGPGSYEDVRTFGDLISRADDLDWTIVRVPFLTAKPGNAYAVGYIGDGKVGWFLRREAYAQFVIDELTKQEWIRKMPVISND